jgi:putative heme transporter
VDTDRGVNRQTAAASSSLIGEQGAATISGSEPPQKTPKRGRGHWTQIRLLLSIVAIGAAVGFLWQRASALRGAGELLDHVDWRFMGLAVLFEAASMIVFARMQRWLLWAGHVRLPLRTMVEITVAGNAISATLPGGVAWAAAWAFGQLRRRGVETFLRVWVFLVAGAVSSFALFLVVAIGIEVAGGRGPVADLRWAALSLAAIPVAALALSLVRRWPPVPRLAIRLGLFVRRRLPGGNWLLRSGRKVLQRFDAVHLSPSRWAEILGLAILNWLYDCIVLVCSLLALHVAVPWRGIFVIYGITQIAAAFPITPGGLVVVEGTLAGLLTAYGVHTEAAFATVILYRIVSFWGLVPLGWGVWVWLDLLQRRGHRHRRPHPWAFHGPQGEKDRRAVLPEPAPCHGCDEEADPSSWSSREAS